MSDPLALRFVGLLALVTVAAWTDIRARRIPNWLTVGGTALGLVLGAFEIGGIPTAAVIGALVALIVSFPLFALGGIGAGDAKLLTAVGAFVGPVGLLPVVLYGGIAGGALGVASAVRRGVFIPVLLSTRDLLIHLVTLGRHGERRSLDSPGAHTVPYGVAIALGALAAWFFPIHLSGVS